MQVTCPWCRLASDVPDGAPRPQLCPGCGRPVGTLSGEETFVEPQPGPASGEEAPPQLGRYRVTDRLGSGAFGTVYRAYDQELCRDVAVKVPHRERVASAEAADVYLREGRVLARLDHPGIVPVYDVGRTADGLCYLVSKFIEGRDLAARLQEGKLDQAEAARLVAAVAEALHHAHQRGLVHRDVKPGNVLLDHEGRPYVADFGLALRDEQLTHGSPLAGTPLYMSPEQARGEGHRVDARTDIFSAGVVLYELLTGQRPFQGQTLGEVLEQITTREVQPPHQLDPTIDPELERICLKALSKRAADRYATAQELADDLHHWLGSRVVPKGLRPFDALDADFFLDLLPGPRDREGFPPSVRFWKTRVETANPDESFAVGLIFGPSGCGKSSLVRAGLLPRLAARVATVYVEAAQEDTERRLLGGMWHACPGLAGEMDLAATIAGLRRGNALDPGRKLLIVLDQFEQFLHGQASKFAGNPVAAALRQADGARVQFLLLVRDDFWLGASRLFQELEIPLVEGRNLELIDLFEAKHARHVLRLFGQAHGCLPENAAEITAEQNAFLDEAVAGLGEDGMVIPVRLSLFAEMMKRRPWTPATLRAGGGTEGVGLTFLVETFSAPTSRPERRELEPAARGVLSALLPEAGSKIKGRVRSREELRQASGLKDHPHRFDRLLDLLDHDLRIITPAEACADAGRPEGDGGGRLYQLTHDYLVPPLREWLTRKQRATWRGRAEIRLAERAAQWSRYRQDRFLPSPLEYVRIVLGVSPRHRRPEEHALMRAATRHYAARVGVLLALAGLLGWAVWSAYGRQQAARVVETIEKATPGELPGIIRDELPRYRRWANRRLRAAAASDKTPPDERLRASLALVDVDPNQVDYLVGRLLTCHFDEFPVVRDALRGYADRCRPGLWQELHDAKRPETERFRAGLALADFAPAADEWTEADADFLAGQLLQANQDNQRDLRADLAPLAGRLMGPLKRTFHDPTARGDVRIAASYALADYAKDQPALLARLASEATAEQYDVLREALARDTDHRPAVLETLEALVNETPPTAAAEAQRVEVGRRRAGAAITLLRLGEPGPACAVFGFQDDPEALTQFVHRLKDRRVTPEAVLDCLGRVNEVPARYALLLALGEFRPEDLPEARRAPLHDALVRWYRGDPSSAIHGASGWLLRTWGFTDDVAQVDRTPLPPDPAGRREWFVEKIGPDCVTFVVFPAGTFLLGSPPEESHRVKNEQQHRVRVSRAFAVADRELTRGQFERFVKATGHRFPELDESSATADYPVVRVTWAEAALYCRWLTAETGRGEADQAYGAPDGLEKGKDGLPRNWPLHPERPGYRLPTEAEWEHACRAGTATTYSFGSDGDLLKYYGLCNDFHPQAGGLLRPNLRGLFDVHGNVWEWCHDWYERQLPEEATDPTGPPDGTNKVLRGGGWDRNAWHCRSAYRHSPTPDYRGGYMGFRIVRTLPEWPAEGR